MHACVLHMCGGETKCGNCEVKHGNKGGVIAQTDDSSIWLRRSKREVDGK